MYWTDIIGHEELIRRLRSSIADGSFPHAAIFSGVRGIGKYAVAELTAAALLCQSEDAPCGKCQSCRAIRAGAHPDLFRIAPDTSAKQPVIKVAQVRQMLSGISLAPMLSDLRVILIDDAHLMNGVSQNSILKTIEEPVGRSAFVLVTDRWSDLLITVRSRCVTINFDRLTESEIARGLHARSIENAEKIAPLADGSLGRAIQLATEGGLELRAEVFEVLRSIEQMTVEDIFKLSEAIGKQPRSFFSDWLICFEKFLRDMLLASTDAKLYNADMRSELSARLQTLGERSTFAFFDQCLKTQRTLASNADLRLMSEAFLFRLRRSV